MIESNFASSAVGIPAVAVCKFASRQKKTPKVMGLDSKVMGSLILRYANSGHATGIQPKVLKWAYNEVWLSSLYHFLFNVFIHLDMNFELLVQDPCPRSMGRRSTIYGSPKEMPWGDPMIIMDPTARADGVFSKMVILFTLQRSSLYPTKLEKGKEHMTQKCQMGG